MSNPSAPERQSNQSSIRLLQILECLSDSRVSLRLQEIAKLVGMTQPTVLRYLYALQDAHYVYQEESTSRYALTWRACRLGVNLNSFLSLRNIATPFVSGLANSLSRGACLVVEQDGECLYLDCIDNPNSATLQRIGKQAPLHATGSGKVLLSKYNEAQLNSLIAKQGLQKFTQYTITDADQLRKELDNIRLQGYGMDNEECELGLRCISMPLRDFSGTIVASLSVFGNTSDMSDEYIQTQVYPALKNATATINYRLGYISHTAD